MKNLKEKVCNFLRSAEMKAATAATVVAVAMTNFASAGYEGVDLADGSIKSGVINSFTNGFNTMATDALQMIGLIVPIALGVAGTVFIVKKAMGWFKSLAK